MKIYVAMLSEKPQDDCVVAAFSSSELAKDFVHSNTVSIDELPFYSITDVTLDKEELEDDEPAYTGLSD